VGITGSTDVASVVAFVLAASMCVVAYVVLPVVAGMKFLQVTRRLRRDLSV
jgi:hypothetical protein